MRAIIERAPSIRSARPTEPTAVAALCAHAVLRRVGIGGWTRALLALAMTSAIACDSMDAAQRERMLETPSAQRLVGIWNLALSADPRATMRTPSRAITGTIAFTVNHHGPRDIAELSGVTHQGVYDLDFVPFGWASGTIDAPAVAVARVVPHSTDDRRANQPDSIYVVMSPGTNRFAVRMAGIMNADSAWGAWSATSFSAGGGAGSFVMRRHP